MTQINKYLVKYSYDYEREPGAWLGEHKEVVMEAYTAADAYSQTQVKYMAGVRFSVDEVSPVKEDDPDAELSLFHEP